MFAVCRCGKMILSRDRLNHNIAAPTAITPIGTPARNEPLATKAQTTVSPAARLDLDLHSIDEHDGSQ
jgi:hypothetical protein